MTLTDRCCAPLPSSILVALLAVVLPSAGCTAPAERADPAVLHASAPFDLGSVAVAPAGAADPQEAPTTRPSDAGPSGESGTDASGADAKNDRGDRPRPGTSIARHVAEMDVRLGLLTVYVDPVANSLFLELPPPTDPRGTCLTLLLNHGLRRGLGSNPVGLDRGQLDGADLVTIRRLGDRVLFERPNLGFRASVDDPDARRAVEESFATSVIWGTRAVVVEPSGRSLIDLGPFLLRDAHGVTRTLAATDQGDYRLDAHRSAVELAALHVFPDNVECEATLTFTTDGRPGGHVRATAPDPTAVSLVQHVSFVRLPDDGYRPRAFDPRAGTFSIGYLDATAPLDRPVDTRLATRHRLAAGETLTYYVDRGAPEPVRSALLEGARWWEEAFAAAGYPDAFRVELLPEGIHPLDVRYSVIQWVHRSTRGWSYGASIVDPRTGEILKGHVTLGALRVRQDRLLFEGLLGVARTGSGGADDPIELSLARIRQLAAHEVGHTLGLAHNFAASTLDRASVMDYPPPRVTVDGEGALDVSEAYAVGVGAWDRQVIRWLYGAFGVQEDGSVDATAERAALDAVITEGIEAGLLYLTDSDARAPGSSDPRGSLWDDGPDAVGALENAIAVRAVALARFGDGNIAPGTPRTRLQEVFAPVYFHHRYALEAATKTVGGVEYAHAVRGDELPTPTVIDRARQERALATVLSTITPEFLTIPGAVSDRLAPRAPGSPANRELPRGATDPVFDPLALATSAAALTVGGLLVEERLARLVTQEMRDAEALTIEDVLRALTETFVSKEDDDRDPRTVALDRAAERVILDALMRRAGSPTVPPAVRTAIDGMLGELFARLGPPYDGRKLRYENGHRATILRDIERHLARTPAERLGTAPPPPPPPGSPIGCGCDSGAF